MVWCGYMDRLNSCVCCFVYRKDGASGASLGLFVVKRGVVDKLVVAKCLSPYRFDVAVFGFRKSDDVCVGMGGEDVL